MIHNGNVLFYGCYDFNEEWLLIEMQADISWEWIQWHQFAVPEDGVEEENWQAPYLEQYLNLDGTEKICELYDTPESEKETCRFVFFLYKTEAPKLVCQFGEFDLLDPKCVPDRLVDIVEFESDGMSSKNDTMTVVVDTYCTVFAIL